ncbi:MAG: hypothetical protein ABIL09_13035 [Gemmatimonadota bacterium]
MEITRTSSQGPMAIPRSGREALDLRAGTKRQIELLPDRAFKVPVRPGDQAARVDELAGSLARRGERVAPAQESAAILRAVRDDDERARSRARSRR